jgi:hypothetical protein
MRSYVVVVLGAYENEATVVRVCAAGHDVEAMRVP